MTRDANELLAQWGVWVWQGVGGLGYISPMHALMRDNVEQEGRPVARITEEEAMRIDAIIAALWQRSPLVADCLRVYYATERTHEQVGRLLGLPRLKVREYLLQGVAYVEGRIDERVAA